jgi:thioredoxin 1
MAQQLHSATDASLQADVLEAKGLVLVDFWAEWCAPCKSLLPVVAEIAELYDGEVKVVKINADENKDSAGKFNVRGLPTLIVFRDGVEVERMLGLTSKTRLADTLDKLLEA